MNVTAAGTSQWKPSGLGTGVKDYISRLLGCAPKTIRHKLTELESEDGLPIEGQRKKGADANG